jgi:hypothetical protein
LIELPSLSVLFLASSRYCVDVRAELPPPINPLVNNNISMRLIQSVPVCLRWDKCLFFTNLEFLLHTRERVISLLTSC